MHDAERRPHADGCPATDDALGIRRSVHPVNAASTAAPPRPRSTDLGATVRAVHTPPAMTLHTAPPMQETLAVEILGHLDVGVVVLDELQARLAYCNGVAQRLLGALDPRLRLRALTDAVTRSNEEALPAGAFTPAAALETGNGRRLFVRCKRLGPGRVLITVAGEVLRQTELLELLQRRFHLSRRECQLVAIVRSGSSNEEVARSLDLSVGTVKQYLNRIFKAFAVRSRAALIAAVEQLARQEQPRLSSLPVAVSDQTW